MDSRAVSIIGKDTKELFKEYTLNLTAGRNIIKAVAFNGDNSMQSNEATIEVAASFTAAQKPSLYALVIGINEFKNPKLKLNYPVADANLFAETLEKVSAGLFDKIEIRKLTAKEATTNHEIIKEIKSLNSLKPDDLFVFYIASHGTVDKGKTGFIKTTELADYVDNEVPALAEKVFNRAQYPTISISGQAFPIGMVR